MEHPSTPDAPLFALTFSHACQTSAFEISNGLPDDFSSLTRLLPGSAPRLIERNYSGLAYGIDLGGCAERGVLGRCCDPRFRSCCGASGVRWFVGGWLRRCWAARGCR